jgi:hypothetical protein
MVAHACNPSTWENEARGARVQGQTGLDPRPCFEKKKKSTYGSNKRELNAYMDISY